MIRKALSEQIQPITRNLQVCIRFSRVFPCQRICVKRAAVTCRGRDRKPFGKCTVNGGLIFDLLIVSVVGSLRRRKPATHQKEVA